MVSPAPARRWRPYWVLVIIPLLLISPPAWLSVAALAGAAGATLLAARIVPDRSAAVTEPSGEGVLLGSERAGAARERPGRPVFLTDRQLSAHALILGASGAGKSTTLLRILTDSIRRGMPVVAIDLKGSPAFVRALGDAAATAGREFALWTPDGPAHWNPLGHGNATELKDKLIATERFTEPHYQRAAERYVQTVLQVLLQRGSGAAPTLAEVVALMDPRRLAASLRAAPRPLARRVQDYVATLSPGSAQRHPRPRHPAGDHQRIAHRRLPRSRRRRDRSICAGRWPGSRSSPSASTRARTASSPPSWARW